MTSYSAISVNASIGLHVGAFVAAVAWSQFAPEPPHYHVHARRGSIEIQGSFAIPEPAAEPQYVSLLPVQENLQAEAVAAAIKPLVAAAVELRREAMLVQTLPPLTTKPAALDDCHCEAPEHMAPAARRNIEVLPQISTAIDPSPMIRRRNFDEALTVSTEVAIPPGSAAAGSEVDVLPRKVTSNRQPPYPPESIQRGQVGTVLLELHITALGTVESIRLIESSGFSLLDQSALDTVAGWRFEPARRGGFAVATVINVPVRFNKSW